MRRCDCCERTYVRGSLNVRVPSEEAPDLYLDTAEVTAQLDSLLQPITRTTMSDPPIRDCNPAEICLSETQKAPSWKTGLNSTRLQLFRLHAHLFDHIFLLRSPRAGHVSVLHEQCFLGIHAFCRVKLFHIGLMP
jgi:hypothetical protein